jgi:phage protein D
VTNYFAPAFNVEVNGARLQADISMNIQQVQVVSKSDTLDTFSLTIVNAFPNLRWTHTKDADLFRESQSVKIKMGYVDDLKEMIEGEITTIKATFPESGTPTLAVEGHTLLHRLHGENKTRTFQKMTDKQIVEQIAADAKLEPQVEDTQIQYDYVMQPNQSDLDFLRERARRIHFEVLVQNKKLIFRKAKEGEGKKYTFLWAQTQKSFGSNPNTLPLKSFSPELNFFEAVTSVEHRAYDSMTKQSFVSKAGPSDQTSTMGGSQTGAQALSTRFQTERKSVSVREPFTTQEEGDQRAKADFNNKALNLIVGSAATIGVPDLRPGHVVELKGLGPRFDGSYLVDELTHSISGSGYQTSFKVKRNATS